MKKSILGCIFVASCGLGVSAHAGLIDRGNGLIYDDVLDITWLKDVNYARTSGYHDTGNMSWGESVAWADSLEYGGFDDWRLPSLNFSVGPDGDKTDFLLNCSSEQYLNMDNSGCDYGYNSTSVAHEMAYMFYVNLGNMGRYDENGNRTSLEDFRALNSTFTDAESGQQVSFENLRRSQYWYGNEFSPNTNRAWNFHFDYGAQSTFEKSVPNRPAWAVRDGDVLSIDVPEPSGSLLVLMGVLGMVFRRHIPLIS